MSFGIELELQQFPKNIKLKDGKKAVLRPLKADDEKEFHQLFQAIPEQERMFIKHRVQDIKVIRDWCRNIDFGRNLPLLGLVDNKIAGVATLHQRLGGWKRHIGRVSVLVHPDYRGRGLATRLINEILDLARSAGLEKAEAAFLAEQEAAMKMFALLGFSQLVRLDDYVKDMQAITHDYVLMGMELKTDEEYASAAG
jgi:GNAT superfamily N-acetyltransferase